jgi:hypothetical protein
LHAFKRGNGLLAADGRKIVEKLFERISGFEIVDEVLERHASARENDGATLDLGI